MKVSAIVVSRMDCDLSRVVASIARAADEIIIVRGEGGVWERWEAITRAKHNVVYVQDDDAVIPVERVLEAYEPGVVTCNMLAPWRKDYTDGVALVGWGAVFDKALVWEQRSATSVPEDLAYTGAFEAYFDWCEAVGERGHLAHDEVFRRECDRVFTGLSFLKLIDVGAEHLAWANGEGRMCKRAHDQVHGAYLTAIRQRIYAVRAVRAVRDWRKAN